MRISDWSSDVCSSDLFAIDAPLEKVTLHIAAECGPLAGELTFTSRHFPLEEPRFVRRTGTRLFMDYTRMTPNGRWAGWLSVDRQRHAVGTRWAGTPARSRGLRPGGATGAESAERRGGKRG